MFGWAIIVLAEVASGGELVPRDVCGQRLASSSNVWERVKEPSLRAYCDLLASATSKLAARPPAATLALLALEEAEKKMPHQVATALLRGRAKALAGDIPESFRILSQAKERAPTLLDDVRAQLAYARAAAWTHHAPEALEAYRYLLVRTSALPSAERGAVPLETALVAMAEGGADEAAQCFRIAEREASDVERVLAEVGLALANDRSSNPPGNRATLSEDTARRYLDTPPDRFGKYAAWFGTGEADAWRATALEARGSNAEAKEAWKKVIQAGGRWSAHASSKLSSTKARPSERGDKR